MVVIGLCATHCSDYTITLDEGNRLARVSGGGTFVLVQPADDGATVLVGPSVVGYCDLDEVIAGLVEVPKNDRGKEYRSGYFLVDKERHETTRGLSREEWEHRLASYGIEETPELRRPNRLQSWF